jgi:predicted dehydrogenase
VPKQVFKVAIIGAGMIANAAHIPAWKSLKEDAEIVAVADVRQEAAQQTAERHQIPGAYTELSKMLAEVRPDIVSVCTANVYHRDCVIAALKAGAHVLCEKPIAPGYADALEMYDTAAAAGRLLFVGQSIRFYGDNLAAKALVDAGQLGEVYYAETSAMRRRGVPTWGSFHMKEHAGGGPIYDLGVHALDTLMWLMGNPRAVAVSGLTYAKLANRNEDLVTSLADSGAPVGLFTPRPYSTQEFDVEDMACGLIRLENGGSISIKVSWAANVPEGAGGSYLLGVEGGLRLYPLTLVRNMGGYQVNVTPKVPADPQVSFIGHYRETEHFTRVLRGEEEMIVKRAEVLNVIRALEGLYRSAQEGHEVRLD